MNPRTLSTALLAVISAGCEARPTAEQQHQRPAAQQTATQRMATQQMAQPSSVAFSPPPTVPSTVEQSVMFEEPASGLMRIDGPGLLGRIRTTHAKATLVNAWASWCGSCKHELPMLQKVARELAAQGVQLLLVSVDDSDQEQNAAKMLSDLGFAQLGFVASGPLDAFKMAMNPGWPGMIPATFLFDAEGKLRYFWGGEAFESELRPVVERFLRGEPIDGEAKYKVAPE
jgi:thiol-disulfide isomerase/thioredoxin